MATITDVNPRRKRINSQRLAWGVMLLSFAVFCAILITVIAGIQYFLFQSRIPLRTIVDAARGTATMVDSDLNQTAVTTSDEMFLGTVLTTDTQSQGAISFVDTLHENQLVASVTIENGSSLNFRQGSRPRFDLDSEAPYWLDFKDVSGEFDIFVPSSIMRPILISFGTTLGPSVRLTSSGHYTLIASGQQVQVINYTGNALLITPDSRTQNVPTGQIAALSSDTNQFTLAPLTNLLGDARFDADNVIDFSTTDTTLSQAWRCNSVAQDANEPLGSFGLTNIDGRSVLRLFRDNNAESHGETFCAQSLGTGTGGLDVSHFTSVSIRATFKIHSQSLSACGIQGSECPLMLRMDYVPKGGGAVSWYHGFYAFLDPNRFYPLNCNGCEQHEQINPDVWYTYDSHNLFETFTPDSVPQSILNLRFYASGHQYEVYVSQVVLLADQTVIADGS